MPGNPSTGLYLHYVSNLKGSIEKATQSGYQFIVTSLVHPRGQDFDPHCDLLLPSSDWHQLVVGKILCPDLESNPCKSGDSIDAQINYASHLGLCALLFECPSTIEGVAHLSRHLNARISASFNNAPYYWIQIPVQSKRIQAEMWRNDALNNELQYAEYTDTWRQWNDFRTHLTPDKRVGIALELNGDLPEEDALNRWAGEPVKAIIIPTNTFLTNKKGFPVLGKTHQKFIYLILQRLAKDVHFLVKGLSLHNDYRYYAQYLDHIKNNGPLAGDTVTRFARGYEDVLQFPLQPLMDNLESCTYEVFEKDPTKYSEYQKAIEAALGDIQVMEEIVIMVVGAGRGPLVQASLQAALSVKKKVKVYAVEKNPNAIITLKSMKTERWGGDSGTEFGCVEVISCDMREWDAPRKADLVVSELLGSFGDNELSPECLDGVWSYVKDKAICIPQSYTSFLSPIMSQRLYTEACMLREKDKPFFAPFEHSYVVHMRNFYAIDEPKALFTFSHQDLNRKPSQRDNRRHRSLNFKTGIDVVCHGFAGYFEATLYGQVRLSTVPETHTLGMFSWFPIYFPIMDPILVKAGETLQAHFWRLCNKRSVWYEWCLSEPISTFIHNPAGRSHPIGLV